MQPFCRSIFSNRQKQVLNGLDLVGFYLDTHGDIYFVKNIFRSFIISDNSTRRLVLFSLSCHEIMQIHKNIRVSLVLCTILNACYAGGLVSLVYILALLLKNIANIVRQTSVVLIKISHGIATNLKVDIWVTIQSGYL